MQPFPQTLSEFVDVFRRIKQPWISYLQQFTQAPPPVITIDVGPSPFTYKARELGLLMVTGGTVASLHFVRGEVNIDLSGQKTNCLCINDSLIIAYSVLPKVQFAPIYGAAPR